MLDLMNILIENHDTLEYLTEAGQWTKNPLKGRRFPGSPEYQALQRGKFD